MVYNYFVRIMTTEINSTKTVITLTPTPVVPVMTPAVPINHMEKPEKFNGNDFKRWQQKMIFYLTTLNLARFTHKKAPTLNEEETDGKWLLQVMHGRMVIFCVGIISSMGWTIHCIMCIVLKVPQKNCGNPWN